MKNRFPRRSAKTVGAPVYKAPRHIPATRRMHVGKELEQFESINLYDNGARFYDPLLMRFTTPDLLALSCPSLSPYTYCANNPVCNVDLDGRDIWAITQKGQLLEQVANKDYDAIYVIDKNGKEIKNLNLKYGSIQSFEKRTTAKGDEYSLFSIANDFIGNTAFEFLATNTDVEWSLLQTGGSPSTGLNYITTSYSTDYEFGIWNFIKTSMPFPFLIRRDVHSHPSNTPYPSGLLSGDGDMYYANWMNDRYGNGVSLNIYLPESSSYISYSASSIEDDFPKYIVNLENIECLTPRKK